jgi:excinuclease ABC subunit B
MDNRPLKFDEFEAKFKNVVAVSATPGKYDIDSSCDNPDVFNNFDPIKD